MNPTSGRTVVRLQEGLQAEKRRSQQAEKAVVHEESRGA